jgi:hypothetical protein
VITNQFLKKIGMARVGRVSARPHSLAFPIYTSIGGYYAELPISSIRAKNIPAPPALFHRVWPHFPWIIQKTDFDPFYLSKSQN